MKIIPVTIKNKVKLNNVTVEFVHIKRNAFPLLCRPGVGGFCRPVTDGTKTFGKTINNDPEKYFTKEIMDKLDDCAKEEFKYGISDAEECKPELLTESE